MDFTGLGLGLGYTAPPAPPAVPQPPSFVVIATKCLLIFILGISAFFGATKVANAADPVPVILVHGFLYGEDFEGAHALAEQGAAEFSAETGFNVMAAPVLTNDNRLNAEIIRDFVTVVRNQTGQKPWLVMHSMGGISGRQYTNRLGGHLNVAGYISMGTPQYGQWLSCLSPQPYYQMCPSSPLLNPYTFGSINYLDPTVGTIPYFVLYSDEDVHVNLPGACNINIPGVPHSSEPSDPQFRAKVASIINGWRC